MFARRFDWETYEAERRPLRKWEALLTVLSLGAYAWAVMALAARPLAGLAEPALAEQKERSSSRQRKRRRRG